MLHHIEQAIIKIIQNFIWEESTSLRIALNYLHNLVEEGKLNLIDIKTRNETTKIIWLKTYLNI
jgi:hypothetical protein